MKRNGWDEFLKANIFIYQDNSECFFPKSDVLAKLPNLKPLGASARRNEQFCFQLDFRKFNLG